MPLAEPPSNPNVASLFGCFIIQGSNKLAVTRLQPSLSCESQIPVAAAEARVKCLLRRIIVTLASRLFAKFTLRDPSCSETAQNEKKWQTQQQLFRQGATALKEASAALGLEPPDVRAACQEALPLFLERLVSLVEDIVPVLSARKVADVSQDVQNWRQAAACIFEGLRRAADATDTFTSALLGPEAAKTALRQLVHLAGRRLLPELSFALLSQVASDSPKGLQDPSAIEKAEDAAYETARVASMVERLDMKAVSLETFAELQRLLQLETAELLAAVQAGLVRVGAQLRRSLEVLSTMKNREGVMRVVRQLLSLDFVRVLGSCLSLLQDVATLTLPCAVIEIEATNES